MDSKKVKNIFTYLTLLLALVGIFSVMKHRPNISSINTSESELKSHENNNDNRILFWELYPELILPNEGRALDMSLILTDSSNNDFPIKNISAKKPLLFFRFSQYDCNLCIDQVIEKLQSVFKGQEDKVNLLIDGTTPRDFRIGYQDRNIRFPVYFITEKNLDLSLENKNLPFLFVLENYRVNKIFVPYLEYPVQTDVYLKNIEKILND